MTEISIKEIDELSRQAAGVGIIGVIEPTIRAEPIPFASVPLAGGGSRVESIKSLLDAWRTAPEHIKGTAAADTLDAFVALVNRHKDDGSVLFGDLNVTAPVFTAVIDYHGLDHAPRFGQHRIAYKFPVSPEWTAWQAANGKTLSQSEWAYFIEEHVAELASPLDAEVTEFEMLFHTKIATPSELVTMSRGMQVAVEARVKEIRNIQSGEAEIIYDEVHRDGSGAKLVVPGLFVIKIPLFIGADPTRIIARLRYRKHDSKIVWFYQLYRADAVVRAELQNAFDDAAKETNLPAYEGSPEA
jgi:uncharacterized protein YfdQ (DUF2303 family)